MFEQHKVILSLKNEEVELTAFHGEVLRELLIKSGYSPHRDHFLLLNCRGNGICGSCKVMIDGKEDRSCQVKCYRDLKIRID